MQVTLRERFSDLLQRYVHKLTVRNNKATGCAPCHEDHHPSLAADLEKCVWYCFACSRGGGVRDFAALVGEPWQSTGSESRTAKARRARVHAEQQARTILTRRAEERDKALCAAHREAHAEAVGAADLLALFHRRPDLAAEFPCLAIRTEREYGEALFQLTVLAARLAGEVE